MRIVQTGDWHLTSANPLLFSLQKKAINNFIDQLHKLEPDQIVITGDLAGLDAPHYMSTEEIIFLMDKINELMDMADLIVIAGNHDSVEQFEIFKRLGPLDTIFQNYIVSDCIYSSFLGEYVFIPWLGKGRFDTTDDKKASESLVKLINSKLKPDGSGILIGHYPILGAEEGGFIKKSINEITLLHKEINANLILLGHQHTAQRVDNVFYAGSLYPVTMRESAPRGFYLHDMDANTSQFIELKSWDTKKIEVGSLDEINTSIDYSDTILSLKVFYDLSKPLNLVHLKEIEEELKKSALMVKLKTIPRLRRIEEGSRVGCSVESLDDKLINLLGKNGLDNVEVGEAMEIYGGARRCISASET